MCPLSTCSVDATKFVYILKIKRFELGNSKLRFFSFLFFEGVGVGGGGQYISQVSTRKEYYSQMCTDGSLS